MRRRTLSQLLDELPESDAKLVWGYGKILQARAFLRRLVIFEGDFRPMRLLAIYCLTLPISILIYQPTACEPEPAILTMWAVSVGAALSLYRLLPI